MSPVLKAGLRAAGAQSKYPRELVYGPRSVFGFGLDNLWTLQGVGKLQHLLDHAHTDSITGHLLRTTYQNLQIETGLPGQVMHRDFIS